MKDCSTSVKNLYAAWNAPDYFVEQIYFPDFLLGIPNVFF